MVLEWAYKWMACWRSDEALKDPRTLNFQRASSGIWEIVYNWCRESGVHKAALSW